MGDINFDIAAAVLAVLNLTLFYYRRHPAGLQTRSFILLIWASFASTLVDILSVLANREAASLPLWLLYLANGLYYLMQNTLPLLFALYALALTDEWEGMGKLRRLFLLLPWATVMLLILSTPLTGLAFSFGPDLAYRRGPTLPFYYLAAFGYIAFGESRVVAYRNALSRRTVRALMGFVLMSLPPIIIQYFFPELLLQCLGIVVFEFFIIITVQNPDEYIEGETGLYTRNGFAHRIGLSVRGRQPLRVVLVAVENSAFLKHELGLQAFSRVMAEVSRHLASVAKAPDFAARLGDSRFALTIRERESRDASFLDGTLLRLQDRFRQPWVVDDDPMPLSARVCSLHCPREVSDASTVFQAIELLETASITGPKGRILGYSDLGMADSKREAEVELAIDRGLSGQSFQVHYQPIFSVAEGRIMSAEALVRLTDAELGPVYPDEFIPVAERSGSIHGIGALVLDHSCAFIGENRLWSRGVSFIEINLSVTECIRDDLAVRIRETIERHGLGPERICLEITETAAADSPGALARNLRELSAGGFAIALDDYGSGYSNINYLAELPFSYVKLDKGMIQAAFRTVRGRIILEGSIAMCRRMGLKTIAEGVETEEQAEELKVLGCDFLQGYYYSRPIPGPDFLAMVGEVAR